LSRRRKATQELSHVLPVRFYLFAEGLFVTAAIPEYRHLLGAQVRAVGERAADDGLAGLDPLISRDNAQQVRLIGPEVMRWPWLLHARPGRRSGRGPALRDYRARHLLRRAEYRDRDPAMETVLDGYEHLPSK
jgi:hypothetical protein